MEQSPIVLTDLVVATMDADVGYGLVDDAAIAIADGCITWVGPRDELPEIFSKLEKKRLGGRLVTPGLIDCHTHLVFGGDRAREFELRLEGASYEEIARAGGGIVSTVEATRQTSEDQLLEDALGRIDDLISQGVTTVEIKSGYGLDMETETKMLRAARRIGSKGKVHVQTSFLGAHAVPPGMDPDSYIDDVCLPSLDAANREGLVDAVDGFCEKIALNPEQISRVFAKANEIGLPVKLHAEQLSHLGGTRLAAKYGALSADHVEYATDDDARALAQSGTVAVLLPGAFYTLRETQAPPVESFRKHGVAMAVATDWNPGSSPLGSILLAMNMACTLFRLTPAEALAGTTRNAARALGLSDCGTVTEGKRADLAVWNAASPAELSYRIGSNPLDHRYFGGVPC